MGRPQSTYVKLREQEGNVKGKIKSEAWVTALFSSQNYPPPYLTISTLRGKISSCALLVKEVVGLLDDLCFVLTQHESLGLRVIVAD